VIYTVARELPGTLSTMPAPAGGDDLAGSIAELAEDGVDVLVSLLPPDQAAGLGLAAEEAAATRAGLAFRAFPIPDFGVPERAAAEAFLELVAGDLDQGKHVAVHCWGGVGRSSLIAAALLVARGTDAEEAWAQIAAARGVAVPETDEQRTWVTALVPEDGV
jgi:protein-tyrosine phosphatase